MSVQRIAEFCDAHGVYMEHRLDAKLNMHSFYFERGGESYIKLIGAEGVEADGGAGVIAGIRKKYKIPEENPGRLNERRRRKP